MSAAKSVAFAAALLGALTTVPSAAMAASGPPQPTITAAPANPTSASTASFSFSDSQTGVSYQCSLDGGAPAGCTSAKTYAGLSAGSHTFQVAAVAANKTSGPASFTWTIDQSAPTSVVAFPVAGASYNAAGWSPGCPAGTGICGTASDPSGVASVQLSVRQNGTGKYWAGSGFSSATETFLTATGTTAWRYPMALPQPDGGYTVHVRATDSLGNTTATSAYPASTFTTDTVPPAVAPTITRKPASMTNQSSTSFAFSTAESGVAGFLCRLDYAYVPCASPTSYSSVADGTHTFSVEATDAAGNAGPASSYTWTVDTVAPPVPSFTQTPSDPSSDATSTFAFTDGEPGVGYLCSREGGAYAPCSSPYTFNASTTSSGQHFFSVEAVDAAGNVSSDAMFKWKIGAGSLADFTISGVTPGLLLPGGAARPITVTLSNPNSSVIYVTSVAGTVSSAGLPAGCASTSFRIAPATIPAAGVSVPGNGAVTLPAQGATPPTIQMVDTGTNQDACQGATVTMSYTGSAHS